MAWPSFRKAWNRTSIHQEKRILRLYKSGLSTKRIGNRLGISKNTAARIVKDAGICRFRRFAAQGKRMVELYRQGLRGPAIARRFKTTSTTVYGKLRAASVRRRKWIKPETKCDHHFFDVIDTPLKAYLLGWIVTDGCVHLSCRVHRNSREQRPKRRHTRRYELILSLDARDSKILRILKRALKAVARIETRTKTKRFKDRPPHQSTEARITIRSKGIVRALLQHGVMNRKTGRTTMPVGVPEELLSHFWRGAIEGDGWISFGKTGNRKQFLVGFTGDIGIVKAFQKYCGRYTPTKASIHRNGKKVFKFTVTDSYALEIATRIYQDAGDNLLKRKYRKFVMASQRYASQ